MTSWRALCLIFSLLVVLVCASCGGGGANCSTVCKNILACKAQNYPDSDLKNEEFATQGACETWCEEKVNQYGGAKAECAATTTDCSQLDTRCDIF